MAPAGAGQRDAGANGATERWTTRLAAPLLLVAVASGLLGQGASYPSVQRPFAALVAVASLLALAGRPLTKADLRLPPIVADGPFAAGTVRPRAPLVGHVRASSTSQGRRAAAPPLR